jgi:hypothetical protein
MIIHLVFFRFAPQAEGRDANANMALVRERLEALPAKIPALVSLACGVDRVRSPASWDFGLHTTFANWEDLETYRVHPEHQAVVKLIQAVTTERAVVDFEQP